MCFRAAGSQVVLDPFQMCRKTKRLRGKMADICRNDKALLKQIANGYALGQRECQDQFKYRRWNCTSSRRSMRKVLLRGEFSRNKCGRTIKNRRTSLGPYRRVFHVLDINLFESSALLVEICTWANERRSVPNVSDERPVERSIELNSLLSPI